MATAKTATKSATRAPASKAQVVGESVVGGGTLGVLALMAMNQFAPGMPPEVQTYLVAGVVGLFGALASAVRDGTPSTNTGKAIKRLFGG
jgi:hypothetical protein